MLRQREWLVSISVGPTMAESSWVVGDWPGCSGSGEVGTWFYRHTERSDGWRSSCENYSFGKPGMLNVIMVPVPSLLSIEMLPSWSSMIEREMVRPSPAPGTDRTNSLSARKNGVKIFSRSSGLIPSP